MPKSQPVNPLEARKSGFVEFERVAEGVRNDLGGEVIARGPEPARDEHDLGASHRSLERIAHDRGVVAHGAVIVGLDVEREQCLR